MTEKIYVTKYDSSQQLFSAEKLIRSIRNAGINRGLEERAREFVLAKLYNNISTKEIHEIIVDFLNKHEPHTTSRYNLKKAIMQLGPTGFPFERYIGRILENYGYKVEVGAIVQGKCVSHEVDVVALKDNEHFMIECKYHNRQGYKTDVKVPMYIKSRFEDVADVWEKKEGHMNKFHQGWVVTNTKFTSDAIKFGECAGVKMLGWGYPNDASLQKLIDDSGLHPITCLKSITQQEKKDLLDCGIVLCRDLREEKSRRVLLDKSFDSKRVMELVTEAEQVCSID